MAGVYTWPTTTPGRIADPPYPENGYTAGPSYFDKKILLNYTTHDMKPYFNTILLHVSWILAQLVAISSKSGAAYGGQIADPLWTDCGPLSKHPISHNKLKMHPKITILGHFIYDGLFLMAF